MYEKDTPKVEIDLCIDGKYIITPISLQFTAKWSYAIVECRMLQIILTWASTVDHAVVYLGKKFFAGCQGHISLSRVLSLDELQIEELDCFPLIGKKPCYETMKGVVI